MSIVTDLIAYVKTISYFNRIRLIKCFSRNFNSPECINLEAMHRMITQMKNTLVIITSVIGCFIFFSCSNEKDVTVDIKLKTTTYSGIKGHVFDASTKSTLSARIVINAADGKDIKSYYTHLPGFYTQEDGSFEKELAPGKYTFQVFHGIDYVSNNPVEFEIFPDKGIEADIFLEPWFDLRAAGWVNGYGHCHLYTDNKPDPDMAARVRRICLAQGVDFVCTTQGWSGYNDSTWVEGYKAFTDDRFILHYGSEMPKYRTGHTWWLGQKSTLGYYWPTMDTTYENQYYQSPVSTNWNFQTLPFPNIPDVEVVQRYKEIDTSIAIMPHPTSWWWQERGSIEKYTSNVSSHLSFGLLAGKIWDGLVVMGYNHDHPFYQNLWFNVLNQGYRIPAIGELDGGYNKNDRFYYGSMRTYYKLDGEFTIENVAEAVRNGRTFVTSGPIIMLDVDGKFEIGDVILIDGQEHQLNIEAYSSGEIEEFLSFVIIYRNGEVYKYWDLRSNQPRKFKETVTIKETERSWYVIKAYGAKAVDGPEYLDILALCQKTFNVGFPDFSGDNHDVGITSPVYFWPEEYKDPEVMTSNINLRLTDPNTGHAIENAEIDILIKGKVVQTFTYSGGLINFKMPINAMIEIRAKGYPVIRRGLYMDYKPHLKLIEELASGDWLKREGRDEIYVPGEVPWEAFNFVKTKEVLSEVQWDIEMSLNERDHNWEEFEALFDLQ